jgi:hypothetical protein
LLPIINEFPEDLRPAVDLWSRVGPIRRALRDGDSVAWDELRDKVINPRLEDSINKFGTYMAAGNRYPSTHCVLAECHAAAMLVLMQKPPTKNEPQGLDVQDRIDTHRKAATKLMQSAKSMVFFQQGDRMEKINSDSLFKVTIMLDFP